MINPSYKYTVTYVLVRIPFWFSSFFDDSDSFLVSINTECMVSIPPLFWNSMVRGKYRTVFTPFLTPSPSSEKQRTWGRMNVTAMYVAWDVEKVEK